ncbi:MAG: 2-amino-4-hydroxy-6-hydroxymethyldihydropteridine diphosphokinase [Phycisphaerae bacterium]
MGKHTVYISLGSNLGDRADNLLSALKHLNDTPGVEIAKISQFFRTEPVGGPENQEKYFNAAAILETTLTPHELLAELQRIEKQLGRNRHTEQRWGPRTCDLDILLFDDEIIDADDLTIPHPRMHERLFVLRPLASIAPQAVHPKLRRTVAELLADAEVSR